MSLVYEFSADSLTNRQTNHASQMLPNNRRQEKSGQYPGKCELRIKEETYTWLLIFNPPSRLYLKTNPPPYLEDTFLL